MFGVFTGFLSNNPFLGVVMLLFLSGLLGSFIAMEKDKNTIYYFFLCLIPVFLIYALSQKNERERIKSFKQCAYCHKFLPWDTEICSNCKYPVKLS